MQVRFEVAASNGSVAHIVFFIFAAAIVLAVAEWFVVRKTATTEHMSFLAFVGAQRSSVFVDDVAFTFDNDGTLGIATNLQWTGVIDRRHESYTPVLVTISEGNETNVQNEDQAVLEKRSENMRRPSQPLVLAITFATRGTHDVDVVAQPQNARGRLTRR